MAQPKIGAGRRKRVLLGLSGGPDSAVAGALLKNQGYELIGFHLDYGPIEKRACRARLKRDPEAVARALEISWSKASVVDQYEAQVLDPLTHATLQAQRFSACETCHTQILLPALLAKAKDVGADAVATGHYAKLQADQLSGEVRLGQASDIERDQSYLLAGLSAESLHSVMMPLGDLTRHLTTRLLQEVGLDGLGRGECPFRNGGTRVWDQAWARSRTAESMFRPGIIRTREGRVLADHTGVHQYRVGAKVELGTLAPGEAFYVLGILTSEETVVVGTAQELRLSRFVVAHTRWLRPQNELKGADCDVWLAAGAPLVPGRLSFFANQLVSVHLKSPVEGLEPGQSVVFYHEGEVLGSGVVDPMQSSRWAVEPPLAP